MRTLSTRRLVLWAAGAVVAAITLDAYVRMKSFAAHIAASSGLAALVQEGVTLEVTPTQHGSGFHGFMGVFGHTDYATAYRVVMTNYSEPAGRRVTLQFTSKTGHLAWMGCPPIVRARFIEGSEQSVWTDLEHSTNTKTLAMEIDLPSPGSYITIGVEVLAQSGYVPDDDLTASVMLRDEFISAKGKTVSWK